MNTSTFSGNGWTLTVEREDIRIDYYEGVEPDPNWSFVDANFHGHRYVEEAPADMPPDAPAHYPTLRLLVSSYYCGEHDEDHESYTRVCRLCGEEIVPGTRRANPTQRIAGPVYATLSLDVRLDSAALNDVMARLRTDPPADANDLLSVLRATAPTMT
jgi:hypothetical protein